MEKPIHQNIMNALESVEHPAIAATLSALGLLRNIEINLEGKVTLTLFLPFPNVPDHIIQYMANALSDAAKSAGGELTQVSLAVMDEEGRQSFLTKEQQNWRG